MTTEDAKRRNAGRNTVEPAAKPAATEKWPRTIRTTMEPHRDYRVEESEYRTLKGQGLIKEERD